MAAAQKNTNHIQIDDLYRKMKPYLGISLGIFLFVLFFQPFDLSHFTFNNNLLFIAGIGVIIYILLVCIKMFLPPLFSTSNSTETRKNRMDFLLNILCWALISVALVFYIRYVGQVMMSMYQVFKIILISLAPVVLLKYISDYVYLIKKVRNMVSDQSPLELNEDSPGPGIPRIILLSENKTERIILDPEELLMVRSADNYVELLFIEKGDIQRKLLRSTMKYTEEQLSAHPRFVRCHRTCIVNVDQVLKLSSSAGTYKLEIRNYPLEVPVSRQFLNQVRESLGME